MTIDDGWKSTMMDEKVVAENRFSLVHVITDPTRFNQALIARGAFGHVDIAVLVRWASSNPPRHTANQSLSHRFNADVQSVSLAAVKTIPNASTSSSASKTEKSLTREAFAELNALRLLNGHDNVTPLLGFYGVRDSATNSGGFDGWDWVNDTFNKQKSPSSLCLVFPYHPIDLAEALNYRRLKSFACGPPHKSFYLRPVVVKSITHDILLALKHIHEHHILHRDIKPSNLYITNDGRIQLGDFGLAKAVVPEKLQSTINDGHCKAYRKYEKNPNATQGLCTLQYRPPELLLGGTGIINDPVDGAPGVNGAFDIWSAGCVLAEMITLSGPLFPGQSVFDQLGRIFRVLGTPTEENWPGVSVLPDWNKIYFEARPGIGLRQKIARPGSWDNLGALIDKMLSLDPYSRPSAQQCLHFGDFNADESRRQYAHRCVVDELIHPSLQVAAHIYYSPPTEINRDDGTSDDAVRNGLARDLDRFSYAKQYALKLASSRRSFLKSAHDDKKNRRNRWSCDASELNRFLEKPV